MLGEVVEDHEDVLSLLHEIFADRRPRVRREKGKRRRIGRACLYDDRIVHRPTLREFSEDAGGLGFLLSYRDVDADHVLSFLVHDRVDRDGRLAGLPVADDELALTTADGNERVDRLDTGLKTTNTQEKNRAPGTFVRASRYARAIATITAIRVVAVPVRRLFIKARKSDPPGSMTRRFSQLKIPSRVNAITPRRTNGRM